MTRLHRAQAGLAVVAAMVLGLSACGSPAGPARDVSAQVFATVEGGKTTVQVNLYSKLGLSFCPRLVLGAEATFDGKRMWPTSNPDGALCIYGTFAIILPTSDLQAPGTHALDVSLGPVSLGMAMGPLVPPLSMTLAQPADGLLYRGVPIQLVVTPASALLGGHHPAFTLADTTGATHLMALLHPSFVPGSGDVGFTTPALSGLSPGEGVLAMTTTVAVDVTRCTGLGECSAHATLSAQAPVTFAP